jgi:hypothetical protein
MFEQYQRHRILLHYPVRQPWHNWRPQRPDHWYLQPRRTNLQRYLHCFLPRPRWTQEAPPLRHHRYYYRTSLRSRYRVPGRGRYWIAQRPSVGRRRVLPVLGVVYLQCIFRSHLVGLRLGNHAIEYSRSRFCVCHGYR